MSSLIIIYLVVFGVGPLTYLSILRGSPSKPYFIKLGFVIACATGLSFALRYLSGGWGQDIFITLAGIALIWFAWIGILAFVAQKFRQQDNRLTMRRWTAVIGALGTTIPWFGLASARMMTY
jgi:hypothetical protein